VRSIKVTVVQVVNSFHFFLSLSVWTGRKKSEIAGSRAESLVFIISKILLIIHVFSKSCQTGTDCVTLNFFRHNVTWNRVGVSYQVKYATNKNLVQTKADGDICFITLYWWRATSNFSLRVIQRKICCQGGILLPWCFKYVGFVFLYKHCFC